MEGRVLPLIVDKVSGDDDLGGFSGIFGSFAK